MQNLSIRISKKSMKAVIILDKMNYIADLENVLKEHLKPTKLQKMIEYYDQYFDDSIEGGKNEEEICEELGAPQQLAAQLIEGMTLKEVELFVATESVRMIDTSLFDIRVHLVFNDRENVCVTYQSKDVYDEQLLKFVYRANHLRILQQKPNLNKNKPYLLIELPKTYKGKLIVKTIDSRIIVDGNYVPTKMNYVLSSKHGKIELNEVVCKKMEIQSENGRIKVIRSTANQMTLENNDGNIDVVKCKSAYLSCKSVSGKILATHSYSEYTELESTEGKVYVEDCIIDDCHLQSEHGRLFYGMDEVNEGLHLDLLSRQGKVLINGEKWPKNVPVVKDIKSRKKEKRYLNVYARTSTGRIEILH